MSFDRTPISDRARGRWPNILATLGVADERILRGKPGPCPFCGGKDRFQFSNRDGSGSWICRKCQPERGDGTTFVMRKLGIEFKDAARRIEAVLGSAKVEAPRLDRDNGKDRAAQADLWKHSRPIELGDPVDRYLRNRGIKLEAFPNMLRFVPDEFHAETRTRWPCMIARVQDAEGNGCQVHRTWLTLDGQKAPVDPVRKPMPGAHPAGSSVRLILPRLIAASMPARPGEAPRDVDDICGGVLGIAEGIESAIAASLIHHVPVWAALNAGRLSKFEPPPWARIILIFADNDSPTPTKPDALFVGQRAAAALANRLRKRDLRAIPIVPPHAGEDMNNQLIRQSRAFEFC